MGLYFAVGGGGGIKKSNEKPMNGNKNIYNTHILEEKLHFIQI
jgi:hypothetical protein